MTKGVTVPHGRAMLRAALTAAVVALLFCFAAPSVGAAGGLTLSTAYPARVVEAGSTVSISLDLENSTGAGQTASLSAVSLPSGWSGYFKASGGVVSQAYVKNAANNNTMTYELTVPKGAAEGAYSVKLLADAGNGVSSELDMRLTIDPKAKAVGESAVTVDYPQQQGAAGSSFSFSVTLKNNSDSAQTYSLSTDAPSGWTASFKPSGGSTQISSISVEPGSSQALSMTLAAPEGVDAGEYKINLLAVSADEKLTSALDLTVAGKYSMDFTTPSGRLNLDAYVNKKATLTMTVTNNSNTEITDVKLSSTPPTGWTVKFDSDAIESLAAGESKQVTAEVTPGSDAMAGDYTMTVTAKNKNITKSADIRVTVKTETSWGVVGAVIIVALGVGLTFVFRKYGRR